MNKSAHYIPVYLLFVSCGPSYDVYRGRDWPNENLICAYLIHNLICTWPRRYQQAFWPNKRKPRQIFSGEVNCKPPKNTPTHMNTNSEVSHLHTFPDSPQLSAFSASCFHDDRPRLWLAGHWPPSPPDPTLNHWNAIAHQDQAIYWSRLGMQCVTPLHSYGNTVPAVNSLFKQSLWF